VAVFLSQKIFSASKNRPKQKAENIMGLNIYSKI